MLKDDLITDLLEYILDHDINLSLLLRHLNCGLGDFFKWIYCIQYPNIVQINKIKNLLNNKEVKL